MKSGCGVCGAPSHHFDALSPSYVYLLGLYLGDGYIVAHPRDVYRLRVFLDVRYPGIIDACEFAIAAVMPRSKVHRYTRYSDHTGQRQPSWVQVSSYSKSWPCLLPQHGPGMKHKRRIVLTDWQLALVRKNPRELIRGLIHSDGCRFENTGRGGW